jgi:hypothetical protein
MNCHARMPSRYMASKATAASMSRWMSVYGALTLNQPAPARVAAFSAAAGCPSGGARARSLRGFP